jgi:trehalose 6-phosphate phosphatase
VPKREVIANGAATRPASHLRGSGALPSAGPGSPRPATHAFFFDVDGTLLHLAPRPTDVHADEHLLESLRRLRRLSGSALALISGRTISDLDEITRPERFAASGMHGFERRGADGSYYRKSPPQHAKLAKVRDLMAALVAAHPRLLLEDKRFALALHYRRAPELREWVLEELNGIAGLGAAGLRVQHGRMVVEVTPAAASKATALADFLRESPFRGRTPVYVGDDLTDESGFEWVNQAGGLSVCVDPGGPTAARTTLPSVDAVRAWLRALAAAEVPHE